MIFFNETGILSVDINNIKLSDTNSNKDDPETIIYAITTITSPLYVTSYENTKSLPANTNLSKNILLTFPFIGKTCKILLLQLDY